MKCAYNLVGIDGNAFNIMGYVRNAMHETGFSKKEIEAYTKDCMRGDYDRLLGISAEMIERCNREQGLEDDE